MKEKIKIIIADDNKDICTFMKDYLEKNNEIEVLGIANTDEEEIKMIEELKPDIVITDLMRNEKYTGLDIIKEYSNKRNCPKFLVISAAIKESLNISDEIIAGYIKKPFKDYSKILNEIKRIFNM